MWIKKMAMGSAVPSDTMTHDDHPLRVGRLQICAEANGNPHETLYFVGKKACKIPSLPVEFPFSISEIDCVF